MSLPFSSPVEIIPDPAFFEGVYPVSWNATAALTIPTYDGSGEATHPSIYDAGSGNTWNGYRFWMAITPYPASDASFENPSVVASNDGFTWVVPGGLSNPIDPAPGVGHNSDPCLMFYDDDLYLYFRDTNEVDTDTIYLYTSSDGVNWNAEGAVIAGGYGELLSPLVFEVGGTFYLYYVDNTGGTPYVMRYRTSVDPTGSFGAASACTINGTPSGKDIWHIEIAQYGAGFHGFFIFCNAGAEGPGSIMYFATSEDGITWEVMNGILLFPANSGWDKGWIYKPAVSLDEGHYDMWYAGWNDTLNEWGIGYTQVWLGDI